MVGRLERGLHDAVFNAVDGDVVQHAAAVHGQFLQILTQLANALGIALALFVGGAALARFLNLQL